MMFIFLLFTTVINNVDLFAQIKNITRDDGLTSLIITCTHVDSKGVVWIGTNNGLNAYAGSKLYAITSIEDNKTGKAEPLGKIETIFEDSKGQIWVSVMDKIFLYKDSYWTVFSETEIDDYVAKDFFEDERGWIWVMLEHFKDFSDIPELKFSFLGGTLEMFDGMNWYKFDEDVAGTTPYSGQGIPRYYSNIIQDKEGNIWLGSLKGVYKFDGVVWVHYDDKELVSDKILRLMLDKKGVIWAATEYGISSKKGDDWFSISKKDGLCGASVYRIEEDPEGRIWTFARNSLRFAGINMIENENNTAFDKRILKLKSPIEELIWREGEVIAFSSSGLALYDSIGEWKRIGKKDGLSDSKLSQIMKDNTGIIWLAGKTSLYQYDTDHWKQLKETEDWLVVDMIMDKNGKVWLGTEKKGVYKYHNGDWHTYNSENGLLDNEVIEIFEDRKSNIWVVSKKGLSIISDN